MYSPSFSAFAITLIIGSLSFATPISVNDATGTNATASNNLCANSSLAQTVYQSFMPGANFHVLNYLHVWENSNSVNNEIVFPDIQPAFRAWPTQQSFLLPLFQLVSTQGNDAIYTIGADPQTPPVISGFTAGVHIITWAYPSMVCGSVPLLSAARNSSTDHYFTINQFDHVGLLSDGWVDSGVVAYVLPLEDS